MWIYFESDVGLWTVEFYSPDGTWHPESDWPSSEAAAERVNFLNGGQKV
jgi:hypothetical protein